MISKELFCRHMYKLQAIYDLVRNSGMFVNFYPETCEDLLVPEVIELLTLLMGDENEYISYFIYELDFGRSYKEGNVRDKQEDGTMVNIDMSSVEALYDYLSSKKK